MRTNDLVEEKSKCCGCNACAFVCAKGIIKMKSDDMGFMYPEIENETECIDCKRCIKVCPEKSENARSEFMGFFAGSIKDRKELTSCASGGAATAISSAFINGGGVVYGVAYSDDYNEVEYMRSDSIEKAERLKASKYAQANK